MSRRSESDCRRSERSDEELVEAIRRSDEEAFTVLYERYYQRVYNFVYLRLRNHADAEEAVQEAFTAVFGAVASFRGTSAVLSWIYGIAKNTVNNHIRRTVAQKSRIDRAESELIRHLESSLAASPEDDLTLRRCAEAVRDEFEGLSGWQAEIFAMRHLDGLPIAEISDRMSRSPDAVRSSLCRVKRLVVAAVEGGQPSESRTVAERSMA